MQQQISLITLGVADLPRSRRFYTEGFGWKPVFEHADIIFYQMNGFVLGTWRESALAADTNHTSLLRPGAFALAHNVPSRGEVQPAIDALIRAGGRVLKAPVEPPHGGFSGYVADPDENMWEIAWNPAWTIGTDGSVTFGI